MFCKQLRFISGTEFVSWFLNKVSQGACLFVWRQISFIGEANFLQILMAPEYWEALGQSKRLALNGIGYCEIFLLALGNNLWYFLVPLSQKIQDLSYHFSLVLTPVVYFLSFHNLGDELESITFLSLVVGLSLFLIMGKKFS